MFRIESYITPILLNHLEKYVKNIRPEDAQFSLWEGEVAFQNLDLRLDVLEEELNSPFEFLSGHIHELVLRVPWTKITSEPIRVTINTIEFVLKLKNPQADVSSAASSPHHGRGSVDQTRGSRTDEPPGAAQPGAVSGLVNKIVNNICVECQNIILKYVEDDIVVSMNVQLLSFSSADEKWRSAMVDVHPVNVVIRKLIQISDLTICVDKRNSAGHIEVCQEPILYRCSFELRVLQKYNINTKQTASVLRVGVFSKSVDMNISSMQFPMTMRLVKVITDFSNTESKRGSVTSMEEESEDYNDPVAEPESLWAWAWNRLPSFAFDESANADKPCLASLGHVSEIGVYIEALNFTLKNSEFITDSIMGNAKRIRYTPVARLTLGGLYFEKTKLEDTIWQNIKAGLSYIFLDPLGPYGGEDGIDGCIIKSPEKALSEFTKNSLFDDKPRKNEMDWCITNYDDYMTHVTDEYLNQRSPILAFDSIEYKVPPSSGAPHPSKDSSKETYSHYRVLSVGIVLRWNRSFLKVKQFIQDLIDSSDYPAYHADRLDATAGGGGGTPKLHPPIMEDYDALMRYIPLRILKFDITNITIELYAKLEPHAVQKTPRRASSSMKRELPYFVLHMRHFDGTICSPLNPGKLVHTTCQLPQKPRVLIEGCYDNYVVNVRKLTLGMINKHTGRTIKLIHIPFLHIEGGDLRMKSLWKEDDIPLRKLEITCEVIRLEFGKCDFIQGVRLMNCITSYRPFLLCKLAKAPILTDEVMTLRNAFQDLRIELQQHRNNSDCNATISQLVSELLFRDRLYMKRTLILQTNAHADTKQWLQCRLQFAKTDPLKEQNLSVVAIWMEPFHLKVDNKLADFVKYQDDNDFVTDREESCEVELQTQNLQISAPPPISAPPISTAIVTNINPPPLVRRSSRNSLPSRKISQPEETIHFSSEREEKMDQDAEEITESDCKSDEPRKFWDLLRSVILNVEIAKSYMDIAEGFQLEQGQYKDTYTQIELPHIVLKSTYGDLISRTSTEIVNNAALENVNWTIAIYELSIKKHFMDTTETVLANVFTTISIAITHKSDLPAKKDNTDTGQQSNSGIASNESEHEGNLEEQKVNSSEVKLKQIDTVNIHVDTLPICFYISETKARALQIHLNLLLKIISLIMPMTRAHLNPPTLRPMQVLASTEESSEIKQFLDLETNSEKSLASETKPADPDKVSMLSQWTIERIVVEVESSRHIHKSKIVLKLEDLLATVDKHVDFIKYTGKIGQFNINYYEPHEQEKWVEQINLRLKVLSDAENLPFLNMTYTSAGLKNFHSRLGIKRKCESNRHISEIIITMQAIEIVIDLQRFAEFMGSLCVLFVNTKCGSTGKQEVVLRPVTAADLPLVHLDSKGVTVYMPLQLQKSNASALIWKLESMQIAPNVENPLQRNPIRADVYSKAAQLGFLNTPGAIIEDRQYELVLRNISAASADWSDIVNFLYEKEKTFYDTNPALEWNSQNKGSQSPLQLDDIFNDFTFNCVFAPSIAFSDILICGQATELNCVSDFEASITTNQLSLLGSMVLSISDIMISVNTLCQLSNCTATTATLNSDASDNTGFMSLRSSTSMNRYMAMRSSSTNASFKDAQYSFDSIDECTEHNVTTDSGFQSGRLRRKRNERLLCDRIELTRHYPSTMSFVAGIFTIKVYEVLKIKDKELRPLLSVVISQPSFLWTQNLYDNVSVTTLFDVSINMGDGKMPETDDNNGVNEFPITLLETRPGELNASRIPPPLLTTRSHLSKTKIMEADVEIFKPIIVTIKEENLPLLIHNAVTTYGAFLDSRIIHRQGVKTVVRASKIQLIKHQFLNADRFNAKLNKMVLIFKNDNESSNFNCKAVCTDTQLHVKFVTRPEKADVKGTIGSLHLQTGRKIFLHPTTVRLSTNLVAEPWYRLPLAIVTAKISVLHLDLGVYSILQLRQAALAAQRMQKYADKQWVEFERSRLSARHKVQLMSRLRLEPIMLPRIQGSRILREERKKKNKAAFREEFYQDDLRAGAFQFVEMVSDSFLPLPYQIQIIKKNFGIICWRYPQPRKMVKINIFPVPMEKPIQIKCRMEYFSEAHECFLHYCDFFLSETVSKQIKLPELEVCSHIWRVVILKSMICVNSECFDNSEEDEDNEKIPRLKIEDLFRFEPKDADFILHPRVLVGCMRIDTAFLSESVPKVQLLLSCDTMQIKLLNQPNENGELPPMLKPFRLTQTTQISQAFLIVLLERLSLHASFNSNRVYTLDNTFTVSAKCLDYGFLNMLPLLEETTMHSFVHINHIKRMMNFNTTVDKIRLNVGPSIIHTLLTAKLHWEELMDLKNTHPRHALIPKCVVANLTHIPISFGQTGTNERIQLQSKECHLYHFISDFHNQELTFFVADSETQINAASLSVPIPIKFEGDTLLQPIRIGDKCLIIKLCKLSATQVVVLIRGQIELISMMPQELRVEFHNENKKHKEQNGLEYLVKEGDRASFYTTVRAKSKLMMRLRFANAKGKGRTGDIPLVQNKKLPWLVKVPTVNNEFVSLWVRILREDLLLPFECSCNFEPQKILITIWPIFEIRSMLPVGVTATESVIEENIDLEPYGGRQVLNVPATHLTDHKIKFKYNFVLNHKSKYEYILSLKSVDWNKFFWYDESIWSIEEAIQKLTEEPSIKWPFDDENEQRIKRNILNKTKADVVYSCDLARDFSCSMALDVAPWGIFINSTGLNVFLCDCDSNTMISIESNGFEMLFAFNSAFNVNMWADGECISSFPIYNERKSAPSNGLRYYLLLDNESIDIVLLWNKKVFKFVLNLKLENGLRIFSLHSKYALVNLTKIPLHILPFAMDYKEIAKREDLDTLNANVKKVELEKIQSRENIIGLSLDYFNDLNVQMKTNRSRDTPYVCFICIQVSDDSDISIPIPLAVPFNRRCLSVQNGSESVPLVVTLVQKEGVYYLSISEDVSPLLLVHNQTDVQFIVAQTSASEHSRVTNTTPEYDGRHFEWYQYLPSYSQCYYMPPELHPCFPEIESTMCNLTLALYIENPDKNSIKWSSPIRTDKTGEKFLHIPNHGDVKVIVCDKHRITNVFIYYIAQMEFSVKDLRSRLQSSQPSLYQNLDSDISSHSLISLTPSTAIVDTYTVKLSASKCIHFSDHAERKNVIKFRFFVKEMLFSLHTDSKECDFIKSEIFGVYIDDFIMAFDDGCQRRQLSVLLPNLQIDNQIYSSGKYDFPVILCAQQLYERTAIVPSVHVLDHTYKQLKERFPMGRFTFKFYEDEYKLSSIKCGLSPVRVYIEDAYINDLLDAVVECAPANCAYKPETKFERIVLTQGQILLPNDVAVQMLCVAEPLQLRAFEIEPLEVLLSVHTSLRLYIALDHSPLSFSKYNREQILTLPLRFGQSLGMHYLSGAIFGAGWVVGSLEILGSPSGLARSVTIGLRDFVSMPVQGLFRGPWEFIVGVTQGSASLLRNITAGTVNSVTKLASSVARNLDRLTLDREHIERTDALRRSRPQGFTEGFSQGITGFGISILGAVGGIARHTLEARSPSEVMTGMGKGIVGAFTKPLSGAAELVALTGQGMLHTVGFNAMPDQRAPSVSQNMAIEPSAYRIWKLLPEVLNSDQILFNHEVTLVVHDQLRRGYAFLTSAVFAIMETQCDTLACVFPIDKVEMTCDANDKTLFYIHLIKDKEDNEEDINYTNQRIMNFLHSSYSIKNMPTTDSLADLLQAHEQEFQANRRKTLEWSFYISEPLGEHIIKYLKVMRTNC